jgi:hypothetical protein
MDRRQEELSKLVTVESKERAEERQYFTDNEEE